MIARIFFGERKEEEDFFSVIKQGLKHLTVPVSSNAAGRR